jgi:hypothetical protein
MSITATVIIAGVIVSLLVMVAISIDIFLERRNR